QRERCWYETQESQVARLAVPVHPLLGKSLNEPQPAWESRLDLRLMPYLSDHRVQGAVIVPATAYVELALAAALEAFGPTPVRVEDFKLANPCFPPPDQAVRLQTRYRPDESAVQVHTSPADGDTAWTAHSTCVVRSSEFVVRGTGSD